MGSYPNAVTSRIVGEVEHRSWPHRNGPLVSTGWDRLGQRAGRSGSNPEAATKDQREQRTALVNLACVMIGEELPQEDCAFD